MTRSQRSSRFTGLVMALAIVPGAPDASAGEFYEKDGVAIQGYDPGSVFHFASVERRHPGVRGEGGQELARGFASYQDHRVGLAEARREVFKVLVDA